MSGLCWNLCTELCMDEQQYFGLSTVNLLVWLCYYRHHWKSCHGLRREKQVERMALPFEAPGVCFTEQRHLVSRETSLACWSPSELPTPLWEYSFLWALVSPWLWQWWAEDVHRQPMWTWQHNHNQAALSRGKASLTIWSTLAIFSPKELFGLAAELLVPARG